MVFVSKVGCIAAVDAGETIFEIKSVAENSPCIYYSSSDGNLRALDCSTSAIEKINMAFESRISEFIFDPKNISLVFVASADGIVKAVDLGHANSSPALFIRQKHRSAINSIALSPDSRLLLTGCDNSTVEIWDLRNISTPLASSNELHSDDVTCVRYHPTLQNVFLTSSLDGLVNVFKCELPSLSQDPEVVLNTSGCVSKMRLFGDDILAVQSSTEELSFWNAMQGNILKNYGSIKNNGFDCIVDTESHNSTVYAFASTYDGSLSLVQLTETMSVAATFGSEKAHSETVRSVLWNKSEGVVFAGSDDSTLSMWRVAI